MHTSYYSVKANSVLTKPIQNVLLVQNHYNKVERKVTICISYQFLSLLRVVHLAQNCFNVMHLSMTPIPLKNFKRKCKYQLLFFNRMRFKLGRFDMKYKFDDDLKHTKLNVLALIISLTLSLSLSLSLSLVTPLQSVINFVII